MEAAVLALQAIVTSQGEMLKLLIADRKVKNEVRVEQGEGSRATTNPEILMESLAKSMAEFTFDPDSGVTFAAWYARYEDLFTFDAVLLPEAAKVRLLLRKLNTPEHQKYLDYILPKVPKDFTFAETVTKLKDIFGRKESLFSIRYKCLQLFKKKEEDFVTYASRINKHCEDFKLSDLSANQFKSLMFIIGLKSDEEADIRTRLISKLEDDTAGAITLETLKAECDRVTNLKTDSNLVSSKPSAVHYIRKKVKKTQHKPDDNKSSSSKSSSDKPRSPCWKCGGLHYIQFCKYVDHTCKDCSKTGHKEGYCFCIGNSYKKSSSDNSKGQKKDKQNSKKVNAIWKINSINSQSQRKFVNVHINKVPVKMQFDTASDVTIISSATWQSIGSPKLSTPTQIANDASTNEIEFLGEFNCALEFKSNNAKGKCLVFKNSNLNLLGIDFISLLDLWDKSINSICNAINTESRETIVNSLKSEYPQLFAKSWANVK